MDKIKKYLEINNKRILTGVMVVMIIITPIILDKMNFVINIPFYKDISQDGWLTVLSALLGFSTIFISIKFSREQFKEDKRISIKPYLDVGLKSMGEKEVINSIGMVDINYDNMKVNKYEQRDINLKISNLGLGNCLRCEVIDIKRNGKKLKDYDIGYIGNIKVDEGKNNKFTILYWYGDILDKLRGEYIGKEFSSSKEINERLRKEFLNTLEFVLRYRDVLGNIYDKTIVIDIFIDIQIKENELFNIEDIMFNNIMIEHNEKKDEENYKLKKS